MRTGGLGDMTQPNDYDVLQKEIAEIKADSKNTRSADHYPRKND